MRSASVIVLGTSPKALAFWSGGTTPAKSGSKAGTANRAQLGKILKALTQSQKNADKLQKLISKGIK